MHLFSKVNIFFLLIGLPFQSWSQGQVPGAERVDCSAWIWSVWRRKSHFNCMPYLSSEILRGRKIFHALLLCRRDQCRYVLSFEILVKPWKNELLKYVNLFSIQEWMKSTRWEYGNSFWRVSLVPRPAKPSTSARPSPRSWNWQTTRTL